MVTAANGLVLLWVGAMRSIMGKASWIRLKPHYTYVSPIGIWFSTIHVLAFVAIDFYTAFNPQYNNGMPTISFPSTMFTAAVLVVHHAMVLFCTKKICSGNLLWKQYILNIASKECNTIANVYKLESNFEHLDVLLNESQWTILRNFCMIPSLLTLRPSSLLAPQFDASAAIQWCWPRPLRLALV